MNIRLCLTSVVLGVPLALWALPAQADVDMTGTWVVPTSGAGICGWEVNQFGTSLTIFAQCDPTSVGEGTATGTIDPATGEVAISGDLSVACAFSELSASGTVTPDGESASGTYFCTERPDPGSPFCELPEPGCVCPAGAPPECLSEGCCLIGGSFTNATRVRDFVIAALDGGDCEGVRFRGTWDVGSQTCIVDKDSFTRIEADESLTIDAGATLVMQGGSIGQSGQLQVLGILTNNGSMEFVGADGTVSGSLVNGATIPGPPPTPVPGTIFNAGLITLIGGSGTSSGSLSNNVGEITNDCGATISLTGGSGNFSARLFNVATILDSGTISPTPGSGAGSGVLVGDDPLPGPPCFDMNGCWNVFFIDQDAIQRTCTWGISHDPSGTDLSINSLCELAGRGLAEGELDVYTGAYSAVGQSSAGCTISLSAGGDLVGQQTFGSWECEQPVECLGGSCGTDGICVGGDDDGTVCDKDALCLVATDDCDGILGFDCCIFNGNFSGQFQFGFDVDADQDCVRDDILPSAGGDNCPAAANPPRKPSSPPGQGLNPGERQEDDLDGDGLGCPCDDQGEEEWCSNITAGASFHVNNPVYRMRVSGPGIVEFSREPGLRFQRQPDIGLGGDDSRVITLTPDSVSIATLNPDARVLQSSFQSMMIQDLFTDTEAPIRFHSATYANGFGINYEIGMNDIPTPTQDLEIAQIVELPAGFCLDQTENSGTFGRLTIREAGGACTEAGQPSNARVRISMTGFAAPGGLTQLRDNADFYGIQRTIEDFLGATPVVATVGPPDLVGGNFYHPDPATVETVHAALAKVEYTSLENQPDGDIANTAVSPETCPGSASPGAVCYRLSMVVPAAFIENNRDTSRVILVGQKWSSLTPVDFGEDQTIHSKNFWVCDDECDVTGVNPTMEMHNTQPASPPTFDGLPANYSLLPNGGGTGAIENLAEQMQTGVGCSGCTWNWTGESTIRFNGGGAGVNITSGRRVGPGDPCLVDDPLDRTTNTGRCEVDKVKRGSFRAEKLTIEGSMGGLAAAESDVEIEDLTFYQAQDPNATNEVALHAAGGVGCKADAGRRTMRNPSDGEILSSCPLDLNGCSEDDIGRGTCLPTHLCDPPGTGICNFKVKRMQLYGMNSDNNPLGTDLTVPAGCGLTLASQAGRGEVGVKSYNPETGECEAGPAGDPGESLIEGFECAMATSGGANVDPDTGEPLEFDDPDAVPPNVYCLDKIRADNNEVGLVVGGNVDVRASRLDIQRTQFSAVHVKNSTANVETVASTTAAGNPCPPSDNGTSCRSGAGEFACPGCAQGEKSYLAVAGRGKSAATTLTITESNIGIDENGNPSSGLNPALPDLETDDDLVAAKTLTIWGAQANLFKAPILYKKGADTMNKKLVKIKVSGSNVGVVSAFDSSTSIAIENRNSPEGDTGIEADNNCYTTGNGDCLKDEPLLATAEADSEVTETNTEVVEEAAPAPKPAGSDLTAVRFEDFGPGGPGDQGDRFGVDIPADYEGFTWAYGNATKIDTWGSFTVQNSTALGGNDNTGQSIPGAGGSENWLKARASKVGKGAKITNQAGFVFESMKLFTQNHPAFVGQVKVTWRTIDNVTSSATLISLVNDTWIVVTADDLGLQGEVLKAMWFNAPGITNPNAAKFGLDDFSVLPNPGP